MDATGLLVLEEQHTTNPTVFLGTRIQDPLNLLVVLCSKGATEIFCDDLSGHILYVVEFVFSYRARHVLRKLPEEPDPLSCSLLFAWRREQARYFGNSSEIKDVHSSCRAKFAISTASLVLAAAQFRQAGF